MPFEMLVLCVRLRNRITGYLWVRKITEYWGVAFPLFMRNSSTIYAEFFHYLCEFGLTPGYRWVRKIAEYGGLAFPLFNRIYFSSI